MADRVLQRIDRLVVDHDAVRGIVIATLHHIQCGFQLRHRRLAHAHDLGDETVLLLVVALTIWSLRCWFIVISIRGSGGCPP